MDDVVRTDLALEEKERFEGTDVEVRGVALEEKNSRSGYFKITRVRILNEAGAKAMRKPVGNYITLEECFIEEYDDSLYDEMTAEIADEIRNIMSDLRKRGRLRHDKIMVVGLGNREATPDALGPVAVANIMVNNRVAAVAPGVMAQTGLETADYVKGIAGEVGAGMIIAIDSLAARNTRRLNTTVQISDTGIHPGSGVGNHRQAINEESMGIPVIAIGVPTVVDAVTIVNDVMDNLIHVLESSTGDTGLGHVLSGFSSDEKHQLVKELMDREDRDLYVTPKDIDEQINILGKIISDGINEAIGN